MSVPMNGDECVQVVEASLQEFSKAYRDSWEAAEPGTFIFKDEGTPYRITFGESYGMKPTIRELSIVITWGNLPVAFVMNPDSKVTYFDLTFQTHSRNLGKVALKLKSCLEAQGCSFREFGSKASAPSHRIRRLPRKMIQSLYRKPPLEREQGW
jgi:hypothetical protein